MPLPPMRPVRPAKAGQLNAISEETCPVRPEKASAKNDKRRNVPGAVCKNRSAKCGKRRNVTHAHTHPAQCRIGKRRLACTPPSHTINAHAQILIRTCPVQEGFDIHDLTRTFLGAPGGPRRRQGHSTVHHELKVVNVDAASGNVRRY